MKVAILACNKAGLRCGAVGCMKAINNREALFSRYGDEELQLMGFMRCNSCDSVPKEDKGIASKVKSIVASGAEVLHIGICTINMETGEQCENISDIAEMFEDAGLSIVLGTH